MTIIEWDDPSEQIPMSCYEHVNRKRAALDVAAARKTPYYNTLPAAATREATRRLREMHKGDYERMIAEERKARGLIHPNALEILRSQLREVGLEPKA